MAKSYPKQFLLDANVLQQPGDSEDITSAVELFISKLNKVRADKTGVAVITIAGVSTIEKI